ncbi:unnamed protein product [Callosobruchus maculatus]|uniref:Uncharacterized protein n=1 Tax=Callosobruchus maculatus TaxID=64391 RepID=A0A653DWS4_CALMS|nr:unnamed protein product [Callosobruchus maculatus]
MKRKRKEDSKRRAKRKRLLEDLREKMEKFERSMESSSSKKVIRCGSALPRPHRNLINEEA